MKGELGYRLAPNYSKRARVDGGWVLQNDKGQKKSSP